jgi:hypothetical protein
MRPLVGEHSGELFVVETGEHLRRDEDVGVESAGTAAETPGVIDEDDVQPQRICDISETLRAGNRSSELVQGTPGADDL